MKNLILVLMSTIAASIAHADGSCDKHLLGANSWEIENKAGELVEKFSFFELTDWSPDSKFEAVMLSKSASRELKNPVLEVEFKPDQKAAKNRGKDLSDSFEEILPYPGDASLMQFEDFKPVEFFEQAFPGKIVIRLKASGKTVCEQTLRLTLGD